MKNDAPSQPASSITLPQRIRNHLAGHMLADGYGTIQIVAATAQNWPELTCVSICEMALGDDGLIRLALWSASKCCAALLRARRATLLLPEGVNAWEVRCLVIANASLTTTRPLSGFLLKPVEILAGRAPRSARGAGDARRAPADIQTRAGDCRLALFYAFPVDLDGENAPPGRARSP